MSHWAPPVPDLGGHLGVCCSSLLSQNRLLQKGPRGGGEAYSEPLGLMEGGGGPGRCHPVRCRQEALNLTCRARYGAGLNRDQACAGPGEPLRRRARAARHCCVRPAPTGSSPEVQGFHICPCGAHMCFLLDVCAQHRRGKLRPGDTLKMCSWHCLWATRLSEGLVPKEPCVKVLMV